MRFLFQSTSDHDLRSATFCVSRSAPAVLTVASASWKIKGLFFAHWFIEKEDLKGGPDDEKDFLVNCPAFKQVAVRREEALDNPSIMLLQPREDMSPNIARYICCVTQVCGKYLMMFFLFF